MAQRHKKNGLQTATLSSMTARVTAPVLVLLALTLMLFNRVDHASVQHLRVAVMDVVTPVFSVVSRPFIALAESIDGVTTLHDLKAENIRLQEENTKLRQWYETALKLQAENQSLRELMNLQVDPALTYVSARVVADPGGAFVKSILLPVGKSAGIAEGSAVLSGHGLIGRISEAGRNASRVLLITDLNSRIPVVVQNTRHRGIVAGKNTDTLMLERLPADSGVSVGSRIVTSGDGGVLPPDIPIGVISKVTSDRIEVTPLADLDRLSHVQVVNTDINAALVQGVISGDGTTRQR